MRFPRRITHVLISLLIAVAGPVDRSVAADGEAQSAAPQRFDIWQYDIEGSTLLDAKLIERTVYPYLGPDRTIKDIDAAREALEKFYRDSGYPTVVVNLPEQQVAEGVVRLQVIEGKVSRVRVSGSRYFSLDDIRQELPSLAPGQVPRLPEVQAELAEVNARSPDRRVTPVFRPGRTPGTVEVDLRVKDELPLHADIELTGRNSKDTTRPRLSLTLRYANLFQKAHSASLMLMTAPEETDDVRVAAFTYVAPRERNRDVFAGYAVVTRSDVATAGDITVLGDGSILGGRYIHPLRAQSDNFSHSLTLGVDYKDFKENLRPGGAEPLKTPIDYVTFSAAYRAGLLTSAGRSEFGGGVYAGVRGLGNTAEEFDDKRFRARPNFIYAKLFAEHEHRLPLMASLYTRVEGQIADSPLVSNEQYSAGGAESVRGYFESQVLGDNALHGSIELRSAALYRYLSKHLNKFNVFIFADGAKLYLNDALPGTPSTELLYSAGGGLRMRGPGGFEADLALAWPLKANGEVDRGELRPHFRLRYGF